MRSAAAKRRWCPRHTNLRGQGLRRRLRRVLFALIRQLGLSPFHTRLQTRWLFGASGVAGTGPSHALEALRDKEFVFVVSYHKCGTRSVHALLEDLGYQGIHWPAYINCGIDYHAILHPMVADRDLCVRALTPLLQRYNLFSDVPFPGLYRELHTRFPKSRFVLIRRDSESWWRSIARQWALADGPHWLGTFEAIQYGLPTGTRVTASDRETLIGSMLRHNEEVRKHLGPSGGLFVGDLEDVELGAKLTRFVGRQPPEGQELPRISSSSVYSRRSSKTA